MSDRSWNGFLRLSLVSCPVYLSLAAEENEYSEREQNSFRQMSSNIIDLAHFVRRDEIDPLYLNTAYYVCPDGAMAAEPFRVISEKMAAKDLVGIARVTLSNKKYLLMFEPRGDGMVMYTLHRGDEVHPTGFDTKRREDIEPEMLDITEAIVERRRVAFDPVRLLDEP